MGCAAGLEERWRWSGAVAVLLDMEALGHQGKRGEPWRRSAAARREDHGTSCCGCGYWEEEIRVRLMTWFRVR